MTDQPAPQAPATNPPPKPSDVTLAEQAVGAASEPTGVGQPAASASEVVAKLKKRGKKSPAKKKDDDRRREKYKRRKEKEREMLEGPVPVQIQTGTPEEPDIRPFHYTQVAYAAYNAVAAHSKEAQFNLSMLKRSRAELKALIEYGAPDDDRKRAGWERRRKQYEDAVLKWQKAVRDEHYAKMQHANSFLKTVRELKVIGPTLPGYIPPKPMTPPGEDSEEGLDPITKRALARQRAAELAAATPADAEVSDGPPLGGDPDEVEERDLEVPAAEAARAAPDEGAPLVASPGLPAEVGLGALPVERLAGSEETLVPVVTGEVAPLE